MQSTVISGLPSKWKSYEIPLKIAEEIHEVILQSMIRGDKEISISDHIKPLFLEHFKFKKKDILGIPAETLWLGGINSAMSAAAESVFIPGMSEKESFRAYKDCFVLVLAGYVFNITKACFVPRE